MVDEYQGSGFVAPKLKLTGAKCPRPELKVLDGKPVERFPEINRISAFWAP